MITLYSFGSTFGVADPSPFVMKINTYLRMAEIEFETNTSPNNLKNAPKGKLPFIEDNGKTIADSQFIIDYLVNKYGDKLDADLSREQKAIAYLTTKSLDENLYFFLVYSRWQRDDTWPLINKTFFGKMPFLIKKIVPTLIRKGVIKKLKAQGLTLHGDEEIQKIFKQSLVALSDLLGEKLYFFGDKPSSLDATVFALLASFILVNFDNPFNSMAREFPNLVDYCERINQSYHS